MNKLSEHDQLPHDDPGSEPDDSKSFLSWLRDEFQSIKAQNVQHELQLARLEDTIKDLAQDIKKLVTLWILEVNDEDFDGSPRKQHPHVDDSMHQVDVEGITSNWDYIVVKKGGYNNVLYTPVRELFQLEENPVEFLAFLVQKRENDIQQRLEQLQAEYQKLQGSQLQEHFRELWESHYTLLKKKRARTWKEEIFLEAFDAFLAWLQD
jgi:hypothetical protein